MNDLIHPTAIIAEGAELHPSVTVGAYSIIGAHVQIG
ncbi:MAG: acyl-[acyl-carrier-protein]--UDP-N-acetylglucosamine O-acyltransferase, partial [Comamonas sp.]|nr:acyl-[acyl-carrier-protein]--UDP-N-acetylglucosamine O-acyltransferase [Comamonas sp.]